MSKITNRLLVGLSLFAFKPDKVAAANAFLNAIHERTTPRSTSTDSFTKEITDKSFPWTKNQDPWLYRVFLEANVNRDTVITFSELSSYVEQRNGELQLKIDSLNTQIARYVSEISRLEESYDLTMKIANSFENLARIKLEKGDNAGAAMETIYAQREHRDAQETKGRQAERQTTIANIKAQLNLLLTKQNALKTAIEISQQYGKPIEVLNLVDIIQQYSN